MTYFTLWLASFITTALIPFKELRTYLIIVLVITYWGLISFRGLGVDADYHQYVEYMTDVVNYNGDSRGGYLFDLLTKLIYMSGFPITLIFSVYAISVPIKAYLFSRFSPYGHAIFLAYIGFFIYLHDFTQIRAGLAIAFGYWALYLRNEQHKSWLGFAVLSVVIHPSLLLIFVFAYVSKFVTRRMLLITLFISIVIAYFDLLSPIIERIVNFIGNSQLTLYYHLAQDGQVIKPFGVFPSICLVLTLIISHQLPKCNSINKLTILFIKMLLVSQIAWYLFYCVPVFASRISQLFLFSIVFLLPIISKVLLKSYVLLPSIFSILGFTAYIYVGGLLNNYTF